jgi:small-conductance mechanosensitive channel
MDEKDLQWPLSWSAVWVGTLSAVALALVFGLVAIAVGAHRVGQPFDTWREVSFLALAFSVFGSFLAFALGGWVAAKVAGLRRSETAMLHGAIAWLVAVPILVVLASMGAASYFGGWYGGLAGLPPTAAAQAFAAAQDPAAAMAARNAPLAAVTALLLGLMGGVVGGWMGSGEPMTFTHYRTRRDRAAAGGW